MSKQFKYRPMGQRALEQVMRDVLDGLEHMTLIGCHREQHLKLTQQTSSQDQQPRQSSAEIIPLAAYRLLKHHASQD